MTNRELELIRCLVAQAIGFPPDDITYISVPGGDILCLIDDYKGYNLAVGFDFIPTLEEIKVYVEKLCLLASEADQEGYYPFI
ncbi:MAG: hypothetical protein ACTSSP_10330 [Candidatus Asgardarchaeia archaeon]